MPRKLIKDLVAGDEVVLATGKDVTVVKAYRTPLLEPSSGEGEAWIIETAAGLTCCNSLDEVEIPTPLARCNGDTSI